MQRVQRTPQTTTVHNVALRGLMRTVQIQYTAGLALIAAASAGDSSCATGGIDSCHRAQY